MDYDRNKIDEMTLALLYLVTKEDEFGGGQAWKNFDWDTMNRLHEKGYISNPVSQSKSVNVSPEGLKLAQALCQKFFAKAEAKA